MIKQLKKRREQINIGKPENQGLRYSEKLEGTSVLQMKW